ncbi:ribbon-helix-helix domain-containing protein [Paracoccus sp. (in: a-proteobacteria)]|uniref:ribbon-helix-helix domain-containing protein n=1 Tax=Paracoccus sp. TaxID=267 RepID=UPI00321FAE9F
MIDLPAMSPPVKRSVTIGGHRTSVSLEDAFWSGLRGIARAQGVTATALIAAIDAARPPEVGLATALRLYVLAEIAGGRG